MFKSRLEYPISGTVNDLDFTAVPWLKGQYDPELDMVLGLNPSAGAALTGLANGLQGVAVLLRNVQPIGGNSLSLENLTGSQAGNQLSLDAASVTLEPQQAMLLAYDAGAWVAA
jgi:hypothetical protein